MTIHLLGNTDSSTRRGGWIKTYTGRRVWPLDFREEDFSIVDVAHSLSMICRFNGHSQAFYSVAEHSLHVAMEVDRRCTEAGVPRLNAIKRVLQALLHDAPEAYLGDTVRPLKSCPEFAFVTKTENQILDVIMKSIGLPAEIHEMVHLVDNEILSHEGEVLMNGTHGWDSLIRPLDGFKPPIRGVPPRIAYDTFRKTWESTYREYKRLSSLT